MSPRFLGRVLALIRLVETDDDLGAGECYTGGGSM
jgi:hypothetical protein